MAQLTRQEALAVLRDGHRRVMGLADALSTEQLERPSTMGHGDWSARDLIGHVTTWEEMALEALYQWRGGTRPHIEDVFAEQGGVDRINAENLARKRRLSLTDVQERMIETHVVLVAEIDRMADEEWSSRAFYRTEQRQRLGALLGSVLGAPKRAFGHAFAHIPELEAYAGTLA